MRIRSHLLLLAAGAMLPVLGFAVLISAVLLNEVRTGIERGARDRTRAMMTAVDAELRGNVTTLQALAASRALGTDDLAGFQIQAERVLATQPGWTHVILLRPSGEPLVDVRHPSAPPLAPILDLGSVVRAVQTVRPIVGSVGATGAGPGIPIRIPVLRDGAVAYVLSIVVRPDAFEDVLSLQKLPARWEAGVVDANGRYVARLPTRPAEEFASDDYRRA